MDTYEKAREKIAELIEMFDEMDGKWQLRIISSILEKMENAEVELNGVPIYPEEIGIDNSYACCATIFSLLDRSKIKI